MKLLAALGGVAFITFSTMACAQPQPVRQPAPLGAPNLVVPNIELAFGDIPQSTPLQASVDIRNDGTAALLISAVDAPTPMRLRTTLPLTILPNNAATLDFDVDTKSPLSQMNGAIKTSSNDPQSAAKALAVSGTIVARVIRTEERTETYLETVSSEMPLYLSLVDKGRESFLAFGSPFPARYLEKWRLKLSNTGPGYGRGTLVTTSQGLGIDISDDHEFALGPGEEVTLASELNFGTFLRLILPRTYGYRFKELSEQVERQRRVIDIVEIIKGYRSILETFPLDPFNVPVIQLSNYDRDPLFLHLKLPGELLVSLQKQSTPTSQHNR